MDKNSKVKNTEGGARERGVLNSFKIMKQKKGKATGYWKGITSTGSQEFTYTVGISNTDST